MTKICHRISDFFKSIYRKIFIRDVRLLFIGPRQAGKTSLISSLFEKEFVKRKPTPRVTIQRFERDNFCFIVYELPGSPEFKSKWDHYYKKCDVLILVVDGTSSDSILAEMKEDIQGLIYRNTWLKKPIGAMLTKNDYEDVIDPTDACVKLDLISIVNNETAVFSVSSATMDNLDMVYNWIVTKKNQQDTMKI